MSNILNLKKCTSFEEQKVQVIFGETFILALSPSAVFRLENCAFNFFYSGDKRLLSEFFKKCG